MPYEFSIVRLRKNADQLIEFPADLIELDSNPIAGPFDPDTRMRMLQVIALFPGAKPVRGIRNAFEIEPHGGGRLDVWLTSDGHLFIESQAGLELLLALFVELSSVAADLAIEDRQHGLLHGPDSFAAQLLSPDSASAAA
jgi:hypothetical protein